MHTFKNKFDCLRNIKRCRRPFLYYSNSLATFYRELSARNTYLFWLSGMSIQTLICVLVKVELTPRSIWINVRSLGNKSADFVNYVCERKPDLFATTETWLRPNDDAVKAKVCPPGNSLLSVHVLGVCGSGAPLLYHDSLTVRKIVTSERRSFEHSKRIVKSSCSHNLRVVVLYHPVYSKERMVSISTSFAEFLRYLETCINFQRNNCC